MGSFLERRLGGQVPLALSNITMASCTHISLDWTKPLPDSAMVLKLVVRHFRKYLSAIFSCSQVYMKARQILWWLYFVLIHLYFGCFLIKKFFFVNVHGFSVLIYGCFAFRLRKIDSYAGTTITAIFPEPLRKIVMQESLEVTCCD